MRLNNQREETVTTTTTIAEKIVTMTRGPGKTEGTFTPELGFAIAAQPHETDYEEADVAYHLFRDGSAIMIRGGEFYEIVTADDIISARAEHAAAIGYEETA